MQDKALSDKQAQEQAQKEPKMCMCVSLSAQAAVAALALPDVHTAALQPRTDARRHMNRRTHRDQVKEDSQVACCAVLCCVALCRLWKSSWSPCP